MGRWHELESMSSTEPLGGGAHCYIIDPARRRKDRQAEGFIAACSPSVSKSQIWIGDLPLPPKRLPPTATTRGS